MLPRSAYPPLLPWLTGRGEKHTSQFPVGMLMGMSDHVTTLFKQLFSHLLNPRIDS